MPFSAQTRKEKTYDRMIEGARKGGRTPKHYTPESKHRLLEGARKGGLAEKHFSPESKARRITGYRKGGRKSNNQQKQEQ